MLAGEANHALIAGLFAAFSSEGCTVQCARSRNMLINISVTLDVEDLRPSDNFEDRSKLMTEKVLDLFAEMKLRATIFVVGDIARKHPETIKKAVKAGHEIGLHSHKHIPLIAIKI